MAHTYSDLNSLLSHSAALILMSLTAPTTALRSVIVWGYPLEFRSMTCHSKPTEHLLAPYAKSLSLNLLEPKSNCVKKLDFYHEIGDTSPTNSDFATWCGHLNVSQFRKEK